SRRTGFVFLCALGISVFPSVLSLFHDFPCAFPYWPNGRIRRNEPGFIGVMTHHHMLMYRFMSNVRDAEVPSREPNAGRSVSRLPRPKLHTAKLRPGRMLPSMSRQILLSICVFITVSVVACSRGLTHDEAK